MVFGVLWWVSKSTQKGVLFYKERERKRGWGVGGGVRKCDLLDEWDGPGSGGKERDTSGREWGVVQVRNTGTRGTNNLKTVCTVWTYFQQTSVEKLQEPELEELYLVQNQ